MNTPVSVLTIGHSTHSLDTFLSLLRLHSVTAVADVRSTPFSRYSPHFNRDSVESSLRADGIRYVFLGRELGARSDDPSCYEKGRVQYGRLAQTRLFSAGIERVIRGAKDYRIALMCAEKEPLDCHRTLLVSRDLERRGMQVAHILADGRLELHCAAMERLLDLTGVPHQDMFRSRDELVADAVARHELRVAYVDEKLAKASGEDL